MERLHAPPPFEHTGRRMGRNLPLPISGRIRILSTIPDEVHEPQPEAGDARTSARPKAAVWEVVPGATIRQGRGAIK